MKKMTYLMMLALGLGVTSMSYAGDVEVSEHTHDDGDEHDYKHGREHTHKHGRKHTHKHGDEHNHDGGNDKSTHNHGAKEFMDTIDKADGLRARGKLVLSFIDEENLLRTFFSKRMIEANLSESDPDWQNFITVLKEIDKNNGIRKTLQLIAELMDTKNIFRNLLDSAYHGEGITSAQKKEIMDILSKNKEELKDSLIKNLIENSKEKEKDHPHGKLTVSAMAKKIDKTNALRKIFKVLFTMIDEENILQKFFSNIMKENKIERSSRKAFSRVLKLIDKKNLIRAEARNIAEMFDHNNVIIKFMNETYRQSQTGKFSLSDKAKDTIRKAFTGNTGISRESAEW